MYSMKSRYVRFSKAWCIKMGLFEVDATGHKSYTEENIWEGILLMHERENKNRGNKNRGNK